MKVAMPDDSRIHFSITLDRTSMHSLKADPVKQHLLDTMREKTADFLLNKHIIETEYEFCTEFSLNLFVFTPDEFWGIVQQEAERIELARGLRT